MKKLLLSFLAISMSALVAQAFSIEALRFHCADDTTKINQILHEAVSNTSLKSAGSYMSFSQTNCSALHTWHTLSKATASISLST